jgi:hypothetical protein
MREAKQKVTVFFVVISVLFLLNFFAYAQQEEPEPEIPPVFEGDVGDKFEVSVHGSLWTIDPLANIFEDDLADELGEEIGNEIREFLESDHPYLVRSRYEQGLIIDSGGWNYGFEVRYYPRGKEGAFSLGLSFEKTKMRLTAEGTVKQEFTDGSYAEANAKSEISLNPITTHINFRWDIKPQWRVTPSFVLGLGFGKLSGKVTYNYSGGYNWSGVAKTVEDQVDKTLKEFEEEIDFNIPNIIPILHLSLGLRAEIISGMQLRAEVGIWDGILFRLGLGYRF